MIFSRPHSEAAGLGRSMCAPACAKPQRGDMIIVTPRPATRPSPIGAAWDWLLLYMPPRWRLSRFFLDGRTIHMSPAIPTTIAEKITWGVSTTKGKWLDRRQKL